MSTPTKDAAVASPLARAHDVLDELAATEPGRWSQPEFLDAWRDLERLRNRLASAEHRLIAEAETRGLPYEYGAKNTGAFIRGLLRVDPREASDRVRAADAAAPRTSLTGEPTPAPFPCIATAQASGSISPRHAATIVAAVDRLPDGVQAEHGQQVERDLVALAEQFDPSELGRLGLRMTTLLDQDGALDDVERQARRRDLTVHQRPDGSSTITAEATAELTERLLTMLDALARPRPATDGAQDPRTAGQRRHDALLDAVDLVARAGLLPDAGGIATTVLLTTTVERWASGEGVATTGHGAVVPVREAMRIAGSAARVMTVELDPSGDIVDWTDARRLFVESQRLAMIARDGGCTFPGCDAPPAWCQAAHIQDHTRGGPTTVDNGALLCGHHHRTYEQQGWRLISCAGRPAWVPPRWIDPDQRPRRNTLHRPG
jgi:hypothetical protein